jgi:glycosyltransferase involved in cell wall biosynthesis
MNSPIVSICCVTYNQVAYIREAINGFLNQKTDFPYEICLGEDGSTDGTAEICKEYAKNYPDKIRLFLRDRKDVIYINGQATGRYNFLETLKECSGKYIAICEGDDYWTDPYKLQKQVEWLENYPDYAISTHNVSLKNENNAVNYVNKNRSVLEEDIHISSIIEDGSPGATCSIVLRRSVVEDLPPWAKILGNFDWPLQLLAVSKGKMKYFNDVMGVYRIHAGGVSSGSDKYGEHEITRFGKNGVGKCEILNEHFNYEYDAYFKKVQYKYYFPNLMMAHFRNSIRHIQEAISVIRRILEAPDFIRIPLKQKIFMRLMILGNSVIQGLWNIVIKRIFQGKIL